MDRRLRSRTTALRVLALFALTLGCGVSGTPRVRAPAPQTASASSTEDARVQKLLVDACYPCHSDERNDPWYAKLAPSSWTSRGRRVLDFSEWQNYDSQRRAGELAMIAAAVTIGSMPPGDYTFFNRGAKLTESDKQSIVDWVLRQAAAISAPISAH